MNSGSKRHVLFILYTARCIKYYTNSVNTYWIGAYARLLLFFLIPHFKKLAPHCQHNMLKCVSQTFLNWSKYNFLIIFHLFSIMCIIHNGLSVGPKTQNFHNLLSVVTWNTIICMYVESYWQVPRVYKVWFLGANNSFLAV